MRQPKTSPDPVQTLISDLLANPESKVDSFTYTPIVGDDLKFTGGYRVNITASTTLPDHRKPDPSQMPGVPARTIEHGVSSDGCLNIWQVPLLDEFGFVEGIKTTIEATAEDDTKAGDRVTNAWKHLPLQPGFTREHFEFTRPTLTLPPTSPATAKIVVVDKLKQPQPSPHFEWNCGTLETLIDRARALRPNRTHDEPSNNRSPK